MHSTRGGGNDRYWSGVVLGPAVATNLQTAKVLLRVTVSAIAVIVHRWSSKRLVDRDAKIQVEAAAKRAAFDFILRYEVHNSQWWDARLNAISFLRSLSRDDIGEVAEG